MTITVLTNNKVTSTLDNVKDVEVKNGSVWYLPQGVFIEDISFDIEYPYVINLAENQTVKIA